MVLPTSGTLSFSQINSCVRFTNGNIGINTTSPVSSLDVGSGAISVSGITSGSINVTGASTLQNVTATTATIPNIIHTNLSTGTLNASTGITTAALLNTGLISTANLSSTTATIPSLVVTNVSTGTLNASTGITTAALLNTGLISTANLAATTATIPSLVVTNVSTGTLNASTGITTAALLNTGLISTANLAATTATIPSLVITNEVATNLSAGTLNASTGITTATLLNTGLISTANLAATTSTLPNVVSTNVTVGTLNASTGITTAALLNTGLISTANLAATTATIPNAVFTTISAGTLVGTTITGANLSLSGNLNIAGTLTTVNITTTNISQTNVSTGTMSSTNITSSNIVGTNVTISNIQITSETVGTSRITSNLIAIGNSNTIGSLYTTGGNVGIGTANPSYALDVSGNVRISAGSLNINPTDASAGSMMMNFKNTSGYGIYVSNLTSVNARGASLDFLSNDYNNNSITTRNVLTLRPEGNVGIGTISPSYTLDVNGSGRVNGNFFASGVIINGGGTYTQGSIYADNNWGMLLRSATLNPRLAHFCIADSADNKLLTISTTNGNVGIGTTGPAYTLDVAGTIARSGVKLPRFDNGTFSGASTAVIPILFSDTQYNYVEIKVSYQVTSSGCNVTLSGSTSSNGSSPFAGSEIGETTVKYSSQSSPVYTTSGYVSQTTESVNICNNFIIKINRATGGTQARNNYMFETVYCWSGVGTAKVYGMGHFDTATNLSNALSSIILTASAGTISGTYSTQHSY